MGLLLGLVLAFALGQRYFYQAGELRLIASARLVDGGEYAGEYDGAGRLSGNGRIDWDNGSYYQGEFENGQFHGQGEYVSANGFIASGAFENGLLNGHGRTDYPDGTHYEGHFSQDLMQGQGRLVYGDGTSWQGGFSGDELQGSGSWSQSDGLVFVGEMRAGKFHGLGEVTYADSSHYVGQFRGGHRHGNGLFTDADGTQFSGDFFDDEFTGTGTITWPEQGGEYVGKVVDWQPEGKGISRSKGGQLIGAFKDGRLHGEGEYRGPDGQNYRGLFEDGQYAGHGSWLDSDGGRYEGEFRFNQFHGKGRYTYAQPLDGISSFNGTWRWGRLVSGDDQLVIHAPEQISEYFLYQQSERLAAALAELTPGDPQKIELYTLALSPYGDEEVFNREINYIESQFGREYGGKDHGLFFSNSRRDIETRPMATVTSLEQGLEAIATKMDRDQDILFLYLTTHGSEDHQLAFDQSGMDLPDLSADQLGDLLDNSGIRWKVVVLSACYSGGFIDRLKNDHTLIFTAAAADKTSFGCEDNSQFTYFGDAFFRQSLAQSNSFSQAFEQATGLISQWEQEQELEPSNPQSHQPGPIQAQLSQWRKTRTQQLANRVEPLIEQ